ncbi:hypothetical protein J4H86_17820 [Spiractinospora alimapuensis]|uniref:hypothetical protein n=1 Tax=Spiractinospora alimapuensis TaxID=2820884 RepID=UPI001F19BE81|nr:hypothetical protein [Spiractinospora alimapuensis]QVQ55190.1 hypothetical protein J4H86_17820 [Spiractinospora alimapuensis]
MSESNPPPDPTTGAGSSTNSSPRGAKRLNEDWVAAITGLTLLILALVGVIPAGLVP